MLSKLAESLKPYVAGEQPRGKKVIKLNTNENPYPPSPNVVKAIAEFDCADLRRYPDNQCLALRKAIAEYEGVSYENVFVGNGSDEVLAIAFLALFDRDRPIKFADVTYSFYPVYSRFFSIPYVTVPLKEDFTLNRGGYGDCGGIVIANPNAPTSVYENVDELVKTNVPVIVDEAYIDFSGNRSMAKYAATTHNVTVVKTFSKSYSLAGARLGYAVAEPETISGFERVRDSFNSYTVNALTQAAATAAVKDRAYFNDKVNQIIKTRSRLTAELRQIEWSCPESGTNFVFARVPGGDGKAAYEKLRENGILVRYFNAPRLYDRLRITVGTNEETDALINAIKTLF